MGDTMGDNLPIPRKLWEHPDPKGTEMHKFMEAVNAQNQLNLETFQDLYKFSVDNRPAFYSKLFEWANLIHEGSYSTSVDEAAPIDSVPRWFSGIRLNWAENIMFSRRGSDSTDFNGLAGKEDRKIALTEIREGNTDVRHVLWSELRQDVRRLAAALSARGVQQGDRVALVGANSVHTLTVFLATAWLGGVFTSSSTDMGVNGTLQRVVQINPKVVFFDDSAVYSGRIIDLRSKMAAVSDGLAKCSNFSGIVAIPRFDHPLDVSTIPGACTLAAMLDLTAASEGSSVPMTRVPFHHPFLICYSSGTTGTPKAIVHSVGGVILNTIKEERLHHSTSADTVALQFTTTGWIMYLLQSATLLVGARLVLYDGSPFWPNPQVLINVLGEQRVTKFGTSPRWMTEIAHKSIIPRDMVDLGSLKVITSTGMPLSDQLFEWVYDVAFPKHVQLINMSGGTDIAGCFGTGNPLSAVFVGGCQGPSLGVPIAIFDATSIDDPGIPQPPGTPGELVATAAFVNMPCFFWGDSAEFSPRLPAPPGSRYHSSYFSRFEHVWTHGDFCMIHPKTGNIHFMGRADGVLNPSGVRFGSSEIYAVVDQKFLHCISDSLCVGQRRPADSDESVLLFVLMRKGYSLNRQLAKDIKTSISESLSKRHVPRHIFEMPEVPVTVNQKKVELPVKQIVSGQTVKASGTLLNPESLDYFYQFAQVEKLARGLEKL